MSLTLGTSITEEGVLNNADSDYLSFLDMDSSTTLSVLGQLGQRYELLDGDSLDTASESVVQIGESPFTLDDGRTVTPIRVEDLENRVWLIPADKISRNPNQPRIKFDQEELDRLARSMGTLGQSIPVKVIPYIDDEGEIGFYLEDGERRWRTATRLGLPLVSYVSWAESDADIFLQSVVVNVVKQGHTPLEMALALKKIQDDVRESNPEMSALNLRKRVGHMVGFDTVEVTKYLKILALPEELQMWVHHGHISLSQLNSLLARDKKSAMALHTEEVPREERAAALVTVLKEVFHDGETGNIIPRRITSADVPRVVNRTNAVTIGAEDAEKLALDKDLRKFRRALIGLLDSTGLIMSADADQLKEVVTAMVDGGAMPPDQLLDELARFDQVRAGIERQIRKLTDVQPSNKPEGVADFVSWMADCADYSIYNENVKPLVEALARFADEDKAVSLKEFSEAAGVPRQSTANILGQVIGAVHSAGLELVEHNVRRRTERGDLKKMTLYRIEWADVEAPLPPDPPEINIEAPGANQAGMSSVADMVGSYFVNMQIDPVLTTGDTIVLSLRHGTKGRGRGIWYIESNIRDFPRFFSSFMPLARVHLGLSPHEKMKSGQLS